MKTIHAWLRLSNNFSSRTRDRCPVVVFEHQGEILDELRTDIAVPQLSIPDQSANEIVIWDDALSRAIDEEAWLGDITRVLVPGGRVSFTLPAAGALAWLDSLNSYRYITDVTRRGDEPDSTWPTGWNRHYSIQQIREMLGAAGLELENFGNQNHAISELRMLLGLIQHNWLKRDRAAEIRLFPELSRRDPRERSLLRTTWAITARRPDTN